MPDQSYQGKLNMFPYDPRFRAIAPPTVGIFDEPQMSICFNVEWAGHIDGVLSRLLWTDAWAGDSTTQEWAVAQITALLVSMIARNPCGSGDCMGECCDDIVDRLEAIEALLLAKSKKTPQQIKEDVGTAEQAYEEYIDAIEAVYEGNITNVHPDLAYGDANDEIRDQALCFICRRFVNICCDWIVQNINLKVANQQTVLNIAGLVGTGADLLSRFFAETAFGQMFSNIDLVLQLEIEALTAWITSVTEAQLSVFQDQDAREALACAWYDGLKGETPTLSRLISTLSAAAVTGNANTIRQKLLAALTPVNVPQQPDGERVYFIWADLWQEAYQGAQANLVPDCLCIDSTECFKFALKGQQGWGLAGGTFVVGQGFKGNGTGSINLNSTAVHAPMISGFKIYMVGTGSGPWNVVARNYLGGPAQNFLNLTATSGVLECNFATPRQGLAFTLYNSGGQFPATAYIKEICFKLA